MPRENKKISVISPSLNTGRFFEETIKSVLAQSYKNFEHIVVDGGSTDCTLDILRKYPHIKWISERDSGYWEAFEKGLKMANGDYIMQCCISDGYLDKEWFGKCVDALNSDSEISLIWGLQQERYENGSFGDVIYRQFHKKDPPQKAEYFYYWLRTFDCWPEGNACMRAGVWRECFPPFDASKMRDMDAVLELKYRFMTRGYLPYFIRSVASFARAHEGQLGQTDISTGDKKRRFENDTRKSKDFRKQILANGTTHCFRNGLGEVLPYKFSTKKFLVDYVFSIQSIIRSILDVGASIVRNPLNSFSDKKSTPSWFKNFVRKAKLFYESRK